ncbi:MAG: secretion protein HlyD [Candidatus Tectimicrobiota bacterium]|nr:MAG: secretion protein HlyD [Candidatus Tectomicrobia bacterium]
MPRTVLAVLGIAGLVGLGFLAYTYVPGRHADSVAAPPQAPRPVPVRVAAVVRDTVRLQAVATGDVWPAARVDVFAQVAGRLQEIRVEVGDRVRAGQLLARLADAELRAKVARAAAEVEALQAEWAKMQAGARPEELAQAQSRVQHAQAELANAERLLARTRALVARGMGTAQELEAATLAVTRARTAYEVAQRELQLLRAGARPEERQALQARLRAAQAALRLAQTELAHTRITAPLDGVVSHRYVDPGAYVTDRVALLTLVQMDTVRVRVPIGERDLAQVRPGLAAQVRVDAYPQEVFVGVVERLSPTLDPATRSATVEIVVPNPEQRLKPGMFARVALTLAERRDALVVPPQALVPDGEGVAVFVVEDGVARRRRIRIGLQSEQQVEVLDTLAPGTLVVTAGQQRLEDRTPVVVVQEGA